MKPTLLLLTLVLLLRLPFLNHPIQGDDVYYLAVAMHAQVDALHPSDFRMTAEGMEVDMRGFPHPPLNAWVLAALLAVLGDVREVPFHAFYILFSAVCALSMWSLARRFSPRPLWAALLFLATPAFVVNGNSLESDLPFLAFWLAAAALFVRAVDHSSRRSLAAFVVAFALAAMAAYQSVVLAPILAAYVWRRRARWLAGWAALATPFVVLAAWQLWVRYTTGEMPAAVMSGYFSTYALQSLANKSRNAVALTAHLAWVVLPALALLAQPRGRRLWWLALAALPAIALDPHPLFWLSLAIGLLLLATFITDLRGDPDQQFLAAWILIFFAASTAIFFAGSARYLLPLAAPVAILASRAVRPRWLAAGFAVQTVLSLALAVANYDHWNGYRDFVSSLGERVEGRRVWVNGAWGFQYYAEAVGGLPMSRGEAVRPGDLVLRSRLNSTPFTTGGGTLATVARREIRSRVPLRLLALESRSAWSSSRGYRPFDLATGPIDIVTAETVLAREPELSYLPMNAAEVATQVLSGIHELDAPTNTWRWTTGRAVVLLKSPAAPSVVEASFRIHDLAAGARVRLILDGSPVAEESYSSPGQYTLRSQPVLPARGTAMAVLATDRVFHAPGDRRELGLILIGLGFRPR